MANRIIASIGVVLVGLAWTSAADGAPTITEYSAGLAANSSPIAIVRGPGGLWVTQSGAAAAIDKVTSSGVISTFETEGPFPSAIASGPDGKLWFTESGASRLGTIEPETGKVTEYLVKPAAKFSGITAGPEGDVWALVTKPQAEVVRVDPSSLEYAEFNIPNESSDPAAITGGHEGDLWFTESSNPGAIGRLDPETEVVTEFSEGLTPNSSPSGIAAGPEGNIWFTEASNPGRIGRVDHKTGSITEFSEGLTVGEPQDIVTGSDGSLYFTESAGSGAIGRITPAGVITEYTAGLSPEGKPVGIASGPDGNIWFVESGYPAKIGRLTVAPSVAKESASDVTAAETMLNARVGANAQPTSYYFEYGPTAAYGSQSTGESAGSAATRVGVSSTIGPLTPGTEYHYRIVAANASGTTYGQDATFTTAEAPEVTIGAPSALGPDAVTLNGAVNPQGTPTTYHFEWGTSTAYGSKGPEPDVSVGSEAAAQEVSLNLSGLQPGATYHYRLVASDCGGCAGGTTASADQVFTTSEAGEATTPAPAPAPLAPSLGETLSGGPPSAPPGGATSAPVSGGVAGHRVGVESVSGSVLVRDPATGAFVPMAGSAVVPVGAVLDTTNGVLRLVTALDDRGDTQSATVWGGKFAVAQGRGGMTDLILRGALPVCGARSRARASGARGRRPKSRTLWTRDNHGRYSTYGANSVATVLGTEWETVDSCAGTLTRVLHGRVRVHDSHRHVTVLVSAGHSYLARP